VKLPAAIGAKDTEKVHVAPGARAAEQVFEAIGNTSKFAPPLVKVRAPVATPPPFVTVTVWAAPVLFTRTVWKSSEAGEALSAEFVMPVPVRVLGAGKPSVPATRRVALLPPAEVGLSWTAMVQVPAGASEVPEQVSLTLTNSAEERLTDSAPEADPPELVTVKVVTAPVEPTSTVPMSVVAGVIWRLLSGYAVPERVTETVEAPVPVSVSVRVADSAAVVVTAVGVKTTEMVQDAPRGAIKVQPVPGVATKSALFRPVTATVSAPVGRSPELLTPKTTGELG
jgi:hypothetical protein